MSAARPKPKATLPEAATSTPEGMSKPLTLVKSSGLPFSVTACGALSVPKFAEFWMNSVSLAESSVYCVVGPPGSWPKLLV